MTNIWYWRSLPLEHRTGSCIFASLFLHASDSSSDLDSSLNSNSNSNSNLNPNLNSNLNSSLNSNSSIATLLESPYPTPNENPQLTRYSICAGVPRIVDGQTRAWTPGVGEILPFLENLLQKTKTDNRDRPSTCAEFSPPSHLPFTGGWLGWLGYDLAWEIEKLPYLRTDPLPFPVAFWYEPEYFAVLDHHEQTLWLAASNPSQLDELEKKLKNHTGNGRDDWETEEKRKTNSSSSQLTTPNPHFFSSRCEYEAAVKQAQKYIRSGDIFQANLSLRFATLTAASGWEIYLALQKINPSPFASYWRTPWGEIASCSPERLVKLISGKEAQTRPIAGTRARGRTPKQDRIQEQNLVSNTKEIAEHIMLVDLERNDLGRVCKWGSVFVDELLRIERYSHVMHLVSNIKGSLKSEGNAVDLIRAMFPGGTITGCPKVRCMSIIEELEAIRRSLFYGSCGYLDRRGNLDLNILIRTLLLAPYESVRNSQENDTLTKHKFGKFLDSPLSPSSRCKASDPLDASVNTSYYCGSSPRGVYERQPSEHLHLKLNIVWGQVGAGIVADSDPRREWDESLHKAQAQLAALKLFSGGW